MFEKFKNLFKKKNKINPQILVGQNLDDAHIGLLSGANSQNVDNVQIESNENVEINPKELEGKSLDDIEFSQLNKENTNSEYKEQEIIDIALERVGNPFANCDLGPMTSESYVKWKSLIIEEILLDKSLSDGLGKEDIEQLLDVVYGEKAKGTFVELYVGRLTKSKFQLLKNQFLEDKNLNRKFNPQVVCRPDFENCKFNGAEFQNINDVKINPSDLVGKSLEAENDELSKLNSDNVVVVDGVKYVITGKVSPPIDPDLWKLRKEEPKYDFSNFDNDDLDNLDETVTYEEKGKSR